MGVSAEVAVSFATAPSGKGGNKKVTVSGATNVAAYVHCGVSKNPSSRFRALQEAAAAANTTKDAAPAKPAEVVTIKSKNAAESWNLERKETGLNNDLTFSMEFSGLGEGKTYKWACMATSLNPVNPKFTTDMVEGTAATTAASVVVPDGDSALWSSLFAAIIMIAAVFFY